MILSQISFVMQILCYGFINCLCLISQIEKIKIIQITIFYQTSNTISNDNYVLKTIFFLTYVITL